MFEAYKQRQEDAKKRAGLLPWLVDHSLIALAATVMVIALARQLLKFYNLL